MDVVSSQSLIRSSILARIFIGNAVNFILYCFRNYLMSSLFFNVWFSTEMYTFKKIIKFLTAIFAAFIHRILKQKNLSVYLV